MAKIEQNTGNNTVEVKGNYNTVNFDSSANADIFPSTSSNFQKKVVLNTNTHPLLGAFLCGVGLIADFITMVSFLASGKVFNGGTGIWIIYFTLLFLGLAFLFCFAFFKRMVSREFMKLTPRLCLIKVNRRIRVVRIIGDCPECGGEVVVHQNCQKVYCLRNKKHEFDFDYTKL
jgi:hypothetical protein